MQFIKFLWSANVRIKDDKWYGASAINIKGNWINVINGIKLACIPKNAVKNNVSLKYRFLALNNSESISDIAQPTAPFIS